MLLPFRVALMSHPHGTVNSKARSIAGFKAALLVGSGFFAPATPSHCRLQQTDFTAYSFSSSQSTDGIKHVAVYQKDRVFNVAWPKLECNFS